MERKRVYIVVKTYPTISTKYAELVCTAGMLEDGSWIRLYPLRFRTLDMDKKYEKYQWIEIDVERNTSDFRPETYRPFNLDTIEVMPKRKAKRVDWNERKEIVFKNKKVYTNLAEIIALSKTKPQYTSLAIFKATEILDFVCENTEREWDKDTLAALTTQESQPTLFESAEEIKQQFQIVKKIPYKFSYRFCDDEGKESTLMIEDWEIGALYWNCLRNSNGDERVAVQKVKEKYWDDFVLTKDPYFFLGTTKANQLRAPNPFIIIGVFYPPRNDTPDLFEGEL
ncbi:hypothetical protein FACS189476_06520 [Spirochaetia bacterium]|nr:hypothetical protein FACS189476_06520 [Spirochaetia bacterium]